MLVCVYVNIHKNTLCLVCPHHGRRIHCTYCTHNTKHTGHTQSRHTYKTHIQDTHTHTQSKAFGYRAGTVIPTQSTGLYFTQVLNLEFVQANPPGVGQVTRKRLYVPCLTDKGVGTQLGGLLPQLTAGHQVSIIQLGRLEQCE